MKKKQFQVIALGAGLFLLTTLGLWKLQLHEEEQVTSSILSASTLVDSVSIYEDLVYKAEHCSLFCDPWDVRLAGQTLLQRMGKQTDHPNDDLYEALFTRRNNYRGSYYLDSEKSDALRKKIIQQLLTSSLSETATNVQRKVAAQEYLAGGLIMKNQALALNLYNAAWLHGDTSIPDILSDIYQYLPSPQNAYLWDLRAHRWTAFNNLKVAIAIEAAAQDHNVVFVDESGHPTSLLQFK